LYSKGKKSNIRVHKEKQYRSQNTQNRKKHVQNKINKNREGNNLPRLKQNKWAKDTEQTIYEQIRKNNGTTYCTITNMHKVR